MLHVMDGNHGLIGALHILHHYKYCDEILTWMVFHRWTGKTLEELIVKKFHSSVHLLVQYVVAHASGKTLTAGKLEGETKDGGPERFRTDGDGCDGSRKSDGS